MFTKITNNVVTKSGENGIVLGFPDVCLTPVRTLVSLVPMPYLNASPKKKSKKLKNEVVKGYKALKENLEKDATKYSRCISCSSRIPSEASICPTCGEIVKVNSSTEFRSYNDYNIPEVCTLFATQIMEMAYAMPDSKNTTERLTKDYIKIYRELKDELEKSVVKYFRCTHCSKLTPIDSTVCQFCEKEVKFISST